MDPELCGLIRYGPPKTQDSRLDLTFDIKSWAFYAFFFLLQSVLNLTLDTNMFLDKILVFCLSVIICRPIVALKICLFYMA